MIKNIKLIAIISFFVVVCSMLFSIVVLSKRVSSLNSDLKIANSNIVAYENENSVLKKDAIVFKMTINNLESSNDSLVVKMNDIKKELKIKNKNIERLEYMLSTAKSVDSVFFHDTIFSEKVINGIDTTITDNEGWYKCNLKLEYPNKITVTPEFKSEKYIITSWRKETVKAPKKTAIGRAFQRKRKLLEVDVVEKNPRIVNDKQKFIEIIK